MTNKQRKQMAKEALRNIEGNLDPKAVSTSGPRVRYNEVGGFFSLVFQLRATTDGPNGLSLDREIQIPLSLGDVNIPKEEKSAEAPQADAPTTGRRRGKKKDEAQEPALAEA